MAVIDVDQLLQELSEETPCGEDLEYDTAFSEMERAAVGKPDQEIGETVVAAEEPDWRQLKNNALEVLSRSKDLRAAIYLARALVKTDGHIGLSEVLGLLRGLLEKYWDTVHPQLDPDDDNDPTMRLNTMATLTDADAMINNVRAATLVSSRGLGTFSHRDCMIASGNLQQPPGSGEDAPSMTAIDAAFMDCELEELIATSDAVGLSIEHVPAIDAFLTEKLGAGNSPDLSDLTTELKAIKDILSERLMRRGVSDEQAEAEDGEEGAAGGASSPITGEIQSREDVIRLLGKISDYFLRNEPSSPVPLLMHRAKRLVTMNFLEILRDMAPDGLPQAQSIHGAAGEDGEAGGESESW